MKSAIIRTLALSMLILVTVFYGKVPENASELFWRIVQSIVSATNGAAIFEIWVEWYIKTR